MFLFIFYVTHEYIKQYADVAEFFVLERQFKIGQTLIDLSIVWQFRLSIYCFYADVAELADAPDLGSGVYDVQVQVLSSAPDHDNPNPVPIGDGFGFLVYLC